MSSACAVYENEDQLLWDPSVLPEREVEEFLYRAVKRRWQEMAGSQLPEGEAVKDSEQVGAAVPGTGAEGCSGVGQRSHPGASRGQAGQKGGQGSGVRRPGHWNSYSGWEGTS